MSAVLDRRSRPITARPVTARPVVPRRDAHPAAAFARDVLEGLAQARKSIPSTWLYDHRGSALFEQITELDAYYPTRTETAILASCAAQIALAAGPGATVIELGSGSSRKTPLLLQALQRPAAYAPVDISAQFLAEAVLPLRARFPQLPIVPLVADFTQLQQLPPELNGHFGSGRRVVFFPGSTIGNFTPEAAVALMARIGTVAGPDALLVVGADCTRDPAVLVPAYDDHLGVTAAFNLNLLLRINRELDADFSADAFRHEARWNAAEQRVEMHLVSRYTQRAHVLGQPFHFRMGESIHTENSYKHAPSRFQQLAERGGWLPLQLWTDGLARFAVHVFERASA